METFTPYTSRIGSSEYGKKWNHCACDILRLASMARLLNVHTTTWSCSDMEHAGEVAQSIGSEYAVPVVILCPKHGVTVVSIRAFSDQELPVTYRAMSQRK